MLQNPSHAKCYCILQLFFSAKTVAKSDRPVICIRYLAQMPYTLQAREFEQGWQGMKIFYGIRGAWIDESGNTDKTNYERPIRTNQLLCQLDQVL